MRHLAHILNELERNQAVFAQLLQGLDSYFHLWRPAPGKWNLLEIACHLRDEEKDDFRQRVQQVLENPSVAPPGIDPEGWVVSRNYAQEDYETVVEDFLKERDKSLAFLQDLQGPIWGNAWQHPKLGPLSAGLFLNNWLAHDYLHIRQIMDRKFHYLAGLSGESLSYAGEW